MTRSGLGLPEGALARALAVLPGHAIGPLTDPVLRPASLSEARPEGLVELDGGDRSTCVVVAVPPRPDRAKVDGWPWYLPLTERRSGVRRAADRGARPRNGGLGGYACGRSYETCEAHPRERPG